MALDFSANDAYINVGSDASLDDLAPISWAAWVMRTGNETFASRIMQKGLYASGYRMFGMSNAEQVNMEGRNAQGELYITATGTLPQDEWTFLAGALDLTDENNSFLYQGDLATLVAEVSGYSTRLRFTGAAVSNAATDQFIGNYQNTNNAFPGLIAWLAMWAGHLSLADFIAQQFDLTRPVQPASCVLFGHVGLLGASFVDWSSNGNNGTAINTAAAAGLPLPLSRQRFWLPYAVAGGGGTTYEDALTLSKILSISTSVLGTYESSITLSKLLNIEASNILTVESNLSLNKYLSIVALSGIDVEEAITLNKSLNIDIDNELTIEESIILEKQLDISSSAISIYETAISLAKSLFISSDINADYNVAISLLQQEAISIIGAVSGTTQTYEDTISLARNLSISTLSLAELFTTVILNKQENVFVTTEAVINVDLALAQAIAISTLAGSLLEGALTLNRIESIDTSANLIIEESIGLSTSLGLSDSTIADIYSQLSLGKSVSLSSSVQLTLNVDVQLGKYLDIVISGGFDYDDTLSLNIIQGITTALTVIELLANVPAKLTIGDKTVWILTASDGSPSDLSIGDADYV